MGLEFETYQWLVQMSQEPEQIPQFASQPFTNRVETINKYIAKCGSDKNWKNDASDAWDKAKELAQLRDRIAHNPLSYAWSSPSEEGEPDLIGIIDMQKRNQISEPEVDFLPKARIEAAINGIASLVMRLTALRKQCCAIRDGRMEDAD